MDSGSADNSSPAPAGSWQNVIGLLVEPLLDFAELRQRLGLTNPQPRFVVVTGNLPLDFIQLADPLQRLLAPTRAGRKMGTGAIL